jgi:hypothetical protein
VNENEKEMKRKERKDSNIYKRKEIEDEKLKAEIK